MTEIPMKLTFIIWLVVLMFSLSRLGPMLSRGDVGGWIGQTLGFALPLFGVYYGVRWLKGKMDSRKAST
jgi:hypothetical protein